MADGLLIQIITSEDKDVRDRPLEGVCQDLTQSELEKECNSLEAFWRKSSNLYQRVRALFFLYAIYRFHLPSKKIESKGLIPFRGFEHLLNRRFVEAIDLFLDSKNKDGINDSIASALAESYHSLGFQTLANQVRKSVRSIKGNQWMFRIGSPIDHPLRISKELCSQISGDVLSPIIIERTPVRLDLTHSGWSDIFFLGMDYPEGARVINISIDLAVKEDDGTCSPRPPVEAYFRIIDKPIIKLTSIDLGVSTEISTIAEIFDFGKDYLGLLKAALIASGIVLPGMEGSEEQLSVLLGRLIKPGYGIELVSNVINIPKGSRLAVSTTLLASLITVCMRATDQIKNISGSLNEGDRRIVAARAILGEWLGGSGGGWQDSGGIWPGLKLIEGVIANEGDPEFGISKGCLLPKHKILNSDEVSKFTRKKLQDSLVLVHGGLAQDVGPILEMVTEKYLLRSKDEWLGRKDALKVYDNIIQNLTNGDIQKIGENTQNNFFGPIQTIIPWASNLYTERIIKEVEEKYGNDFWGFWMMGGMSGGGMGFIFNPEVKADALKSLSHLMSDAKKDLQNSIPFAIEPVVYEFEINENGSFSKIIHDDALMPVGYYSLNTPALVKDRSVKLSDGEKRELVALSERCNSDLEYKSLIQSFFDILLPGKIKTSEKQQSLDQLLVEYGFDIKQHEQIRADIKSGRIGLAQNKLPVSTEIKDVHEVDIFKIGTDSNNELQTIGLSALKNGEVAVVSLAGGAGSRWTHGAGVVKALNSFCKLSGNHRTFIETHLAKSRKVSNSANKYIPHVFTTSYLTHSPIKSYLNLAGNYNYDGDIYLSEGKFIGLRMIPTVRDLQYEWEEMPQKLLDEQAQKVLESSRGALMSWASEMGEASDYKDNLPLQCLHPVGHWYEVPNLFRNGTLLKMIKEHPNLKYLMLHNIDTLGANVDPTILGYFINQKKTQLTEVITKRIDDRGGGLARVDGKVRLVEGLTMPDEKIEFDLSYYNSATSWLKIDELLAAFNLTISDLENENKVIESIRTVAKRMPTYVTIKDVKKRWGNGQEDVFPVMQFEKLWGDMTALPEFDCGYIEVSRNRGQQLKDPSQLDGWLRDGSADYVDSLCTW